MVKKCASKKLPEPVVQAREQLGGHEITAGNIKAMVDPKTYAAKLTSACRSSPEQQKQYKLLKTDDERRQARAAFVIDPQECKGLGVNSMTVVNSSKDHEDGCLASPDYLNDPELARAIIESKELPERDNEYQGFQKTGIKQYWFPMKYMAKQTGTEEKAKVEIQCNVTKEEYTQVSDAMRNLQDEAPSERLGSTATRSLSLQKQSEFAN